MSEEQQMEQTFLVLNKIKDEMDTPYFNILLFYFYSQTKGEFQVQMNSKFQINSSLNYARNNYNSQTYGFRYPFVWGPTIYNDGSHVELKIFLDKTSVWNSPNLSGDSMLFLRKKNGINKKLRTKIIKKINSIHQTKNFYDRMIYFRLIDDEDFYQYISANMKIKLGLVSNDKRKFLKERIKQNKNITLSALQLMLLGDYNIETILKALSHEKARL